MTRLSLDSLRAKVCLGSITMIRAEPCVVRIPGQMMLDLLLGELGFPAARYSRRGYLNNTMSFTILFWTSVHNNGSCRTQMSITGVRSSDEAAAEDSASFEAIRTIENATNTLVKDLNYGCLNRMERDFGYLRLRLNEAFDTIDRLAKGYLYAVRYMTAFSDQLHNVIAHAFTPTRAVDKSTNEALKNIEVVAHNLRDRSNSLENKLYVLRRQSQAREHEVFAPVAFFREARKRKGRDV